MPPPHDIKTLRSLQGKIQSIRCFITQLSNTCLPFNELIKKDVLFEWDEEYHKAFDDIKQYILNPPFLILLKQEVPFHLYLSAIDFTLGIMLVQKNEQANKHAIYYLSHTLVNYEIKHIYIEKVFLVVVFATKKLLYYMLNHTMYVISRVDPLKYMMSKTYHVPIRV